MVEELVGDKIQAALSTTADATRIGQCITARRIGGFGGGNGLGLPWSKTCWHCMRRLISARPGRTMSDRGRAVDICIPPALAGDVLQMAEDSTILPGKAEK